MRSTLFSGVFCLFLGSLCAQDTTVVVSTSELNFLYAGVPNLVKIGFAKMDEPYYLNCFCDEISNTDLAGNPLPPHQFMVFPADNVRTIIEVYRALDPDTIRVASVEFYNISLPDPELYFGATAPGELFNPEESRLFLRFSPNTFAIDYHYQIRDWKVKIGKKWYSGSGDKLTSDVREKILRLKENTKVEFEVRCIADDKRERIINAFFYKGNKIEGEIPDENGDLPSEKRSN